MTLHLEKQNSWRPELYTKPLTKHFHLPENDHLMSIVPQRPPTTTPGLLDGRRIEILTLDVRCDGLDNLHAGGDKAERYSSTYANSSIL